MCADGPPGGKQIPFSAVRITPSFQDQLSCRMEWFWLCWLTTEMMMMKKKKKTVKYCTVFLFHAVL